MTSTRQEMVDIASAVERAGVRFGWIEDPDDPTIVFEYWTLADIQKQYREEDRERYEWSRAFVTNKFGRAPKEDLDNLWQEMRRCAWALGEIGMHFWMRHTDEELQVYGAMVREFQSATRTAITRYVHAVGDRPEAWENVRVFCLDWHKDNEKPMYREAVN